MPSIMQAPLSGARPCACSRNDNLKTFEKAWRKQETQRAIISRAVKGVTSDGLQAA